MHLRVAGAGSLLSAGDRLGLGAELAGWIPAGSGRSFGTLTLRVEARSGAGPSPWLLSGRLGVRATTDGAPLGLWAGAGAEPPTWGLLRGHALLDDGVVARGPFGRTLFYGGVTLRRVVIRPGPATVEGALFTDVGVAWRVPGVAAGDDPASAFPFREGVVHVDPGVGLRVDLPGTSGLLRLDVARDLRGGGWRWSAGWRIPWSVVRGRWRASRPSP